MEAFGVWDEYCIGLSQRMVLLCILPVLISTAWIIRTALIQASHLLEHAHSILLVFEYAETCKNQVLDICDLGYGSSCEED